jgi:FSR family fosmidomycin resistance protein-like MFS transporter
MAMLSAGHLSVDLCQGALPALLPFFVSQRGWSYGQASALVLAATVSSSVIQPLFGHLSDRRSLPWLMPGGVLLAGLGIAAAVLVHTYGLVFGAIVVSGLGVAAYHPEASRYANYVSGPRRATGMSLFSVGGNLGFALGPAVVTPLVLLLGLRGAALAAVVPGAVALVLVAELGRLRGFRPGAAGRARAAEQGPDVWGPFARLGAVVTLRSVVWFGLMTFVPLYFVHDLGTGKAAANAALTLMLLSGAAGTLVGGPAADRFGRRRVMLASFAVLTPLGLLLLALGPIPATIVLVLMGGGVVATFSVSVVMGQEYLPGHLGVASGVTLGLSIGLGGVAAALLGQLADATGLRTVLEVVALVPLAATALVFALPRDRRPAVPATRTPAPTARLEEPTRVGERAGA